MAVTMLMTATREQQRADDVYDQTDDRDQRSVPNCT